MTDKIQLKENVLIMDASYYCRLLPMCRKFLSDHLHREVSEADLVAWIDLMATDAGVVNGVSELQVILTRHPDEKAMKGALPANFEDYDGKSTLERMREISFSVISAEDLAHGADFFLDVMTVVYNSGQVRQLILLPDEDLLSAQQIDETTDKLKSDMQMSDESITFPAVSMYGMHKPKALKHVRWEVVMPFMTFACGVTAEEAAAM